MRPTSRALQQSVKLVLFSRANCSLCEAAKSVVCRIRKANDVAYSEIDVMTKGNEHWKSLYEFDAPVVLLSFLEYISKSDMASCMFN